MHDKQRLEQSIAGLRGDADHFRKIVGNADELMRKLCDHAERVAKNHGYEPWSVIGTILGHGSGVSSAIYECYKSEGDGR